MDRRIEVPMAKLQQRGRKRERFQDLGSLLDQTRFPFATAEFLVSSRGFKAFSVRLTKVAVSRARTVNNRAPLCRVARPLAGLRGPSIMPLLTRDD